MSFETTPEDRALIAGIIKASPTPLRVDSIVLRCGLNVTTVRKCLNALRASHKVYNVATNAQPSYAWSANRPKPAPRAHPITNGGITEPLTIDQMHSLRPGAMDYQNIPSLVGRDRVPYRAGVVR